MELFASSVKSVPNQNMPIHPLRRALANKGASEGSLKLRKIWLKLLEKPSAYSSFLQKL